MRFELMLRAVAACVFLSVSAFAAPCIQFERIRIDAGSVRSGTKVRSVFVFKNIGDEDLEVTAVEKSCSCTLAKPVSPKLRPGESSTIEIVFTAPGTGDDVLRSIAVRTNDPDQPVTRLQVSAKLVPIATLNPERLNFGNLKVGGMIETTVTVTPVEVGTFKVESVASAGKHVSVPEFKPLDDGKDSYSLKVVIKAGDTPGRVLELVRIKTNVPGAEVPLLVFGNVVK